MRNIKKILLSLSIIYIPMWFVFFIERITPFNFLEQLFGIKPRDFSFIEIFGITGSWLSHANYQHIINNSISMFPLLFFIILLEKNIFKLLSLLIISSGFSTWLLGSSNSLHIGASGFIFSLLGFIITSLFISKKLIYLIPISFFSFYYGISFYINFLHSLIPQEGISFAGHFGGLISGMLIGSFFDKKIIEKNKKILHK